MEESIQKEEQNREEEKFFRYYTTVPIHPSWEVGICTNRKRVHSIRGKRWFMHACRLVLKAQRSDRLAAGLVKVVRMDHGKPLHGADHIKYFFPCQQAGRKVRTGSKPSSPPPYVGKPLVKPLRFVQTSLFATKSVDGEGLGPG